MPQRLRRGLLPAPVHPKLRICRHQVRVDVLTKSVPEVCLVRARLPQLRQLLLHGLRVQDGQQGLQQPPQLLPVIHLARALVRAKVEEGFQLTISLREGLVQEAEVLRHAREPGKVGAVALAAGAQAVDAVGLLLVELPRILAFRAQGTQLLLGLWSVKDCQHLALKAVSLLCILQSSDVVRLQVHDVRGPQADRVSPLVLHEAHDGALLAIHFPPALRLQSKDLDAVPQRRGQRPQWGRGAGAQRHKHLANVLGTVQVLHRVGNLL
mmetsp:Transcript_117827/g.345177  ORF Transcript_117827/g.345177 Transcript_117827/m.345177 type:complete len:267 (+) Transcript_117827:2448-3248(+)